MSEPLLQWRKVQVDSGLALVGVQNLLSLLFQVFQSWRLTVAYQSATEFGFSAVAGRTKRFPPTSLPLQENVVWILRHQQRDGPTWSKSNTRDLSTAVLEGVLFSTRWWNPGERRSVWRARLPWLLALQNVTMSGPQWKRH